MKWNKVMVFVGVVLILVGGGIIVYSKMDNQTFKKTMSELSATRLKPIMSWATLVGFFDDFEHQTYDNWTNTNFIIATDFKIDSYSSKCETTSKVGNDCDLITDVSIDTSTAEYVNLTIWYMDDDMDGGAGDDGDLYFNDSGGNWDFIAELDAGTLGQADDTWNYMTFATSNSQYFHEGFAVWFDLNLEKGENYWVDNISVETFVPVTVSWNQTSLDFGETNTNKSMEVEIDAISDHTNVIVECDGNCTEITHNFTTKSMNGGTSELVKFTCDNLTSGSFSADFNVTSTEDTSSNFINVTCDVFHYGSLHVNILNPINASGYSTGDTNLTLNVSVNCFGSGADVRCGTVNAYAQYNLSASPDTLINTTEGGLPFYIIGGGSGGLCYQESTNTSNQSGTDGDCDLDYNGGYEEIGIWDGIPFEFYRAFDGNWSTETLQETGESAELIVTYVIPDGATSESNTTHKVEYEGIPQDQKNETIPQSCWDYNTTHLIMNYSLPFNDPFYNLTVSCKSGASSWELINAGSIDLHTTRDGIFEEAMWWVIGGVDNPLSSTTLSQGESYQFNWTLNVSSITANETYLLDTFFNSSYGSALVPDNETGDRFVSLNFGGAAPADTCTYSSGDWAVDCSDNCVISSPVDLGGNDLSIIGTGTFTMTSDIINFGKITLKGTDASNICSVKCIGGCFNDQ